MQITIADATAEAAFPTPCRIWCNDHFSAVVSVCVVHVELKRLCFMGLNKAEQVFRLIHDSISSNDVIAVRSQPRQCCGGIRFHFQHVPNIFVGPIEAAEPDANPQQALAAPQVAGCDRGLPQLQGFAAVDEHLHRLLHIGFQQVLQSVVVLI